jgi:hypothetical protein
VELLIARNPDPDSRLPYLLRLPLGDGLVFRTKDTWPRTTALYCYPVPATDWPERPDVVERVPLRACARRGAAIDVVADRSREHRSQIVFTTARGREMVFWQSPRTRKQARPDVRLPTARAVGIDHELEILVDAHERYPFRFANQQVRTVRRGLACGDYAVSVDDKVVVAVERKSLPDLVSSLTSGRLRYALGELATLPRAAVVARTVTRGSSPWSGCAPLRWPTAWPSCRSAGPHFPSPSATTASWPRSGPTATWPPPGPGPPASARRSTASAPATTAPPAALRRRPPPPARSVPGRGTRASPCRTRG